MKFDLNIKIFGIQYTTVCYLNLGVTLLFKRVTTNDVGPIPDSYNLWLQGMMSSELFVGSVHPARILTKKDSLLVIIKCKTL